MARRAHQTFNDDEPGVIHIDIKGLSQMPDKTSLRYLFVAIDRATRWVFMHICGDMTEASRVDYCVGSNWLHQSRSARS